MTLSYAHGAFAERLLGETIGENFDRTVRSHPDVEALVSCHQRIRYTYAELAEAVDLLASGMLEATRERRPRRDLESEPRRVGARPVRHSQDRGHPRQYQPRLSPDRARVRTRSVRLPLADRRARMQGLGLRRDDRGG